MIDARCPPSYTEVQMADAMYAQGSAQEGQPRFCSKCGGSLLTRGQFCPGCGTAVPADKNFCAACGHNLNAIGSRCQHCGESLGNGARPAASAQPVPTQSAFATVSSQNASTNKKSSIGKGDIVATVVGVIACIAGSMTWVKVNMGIVLLGNLGSSDYSLFSLITLAQRLTEGSSISDLNTFLGITVVLLFIWIVVLISTIAGVAACIRGVSNEECWAISALVLFLAAALCYVAAAVINDGATYIAITGMPIFSTVLAIAAAVIPSATRNIA